MKFLSNSLIILGACIGLAFCAASADADPAGSNSVSPVPGQCVENHICTAGLPPPSIFCRCPIPAGMSGQWNCHALCFCLSAQQSFCCPQLNQTCKGLAPTQPPGSLKYKVSFTQVRPGMNCPGNPPFMCCYTPTGGGGCTPPPPNTPPLHMCV